MDPDASRRRRPARAAIVWFSALAACAAPAARHAPAAPTAATQAPADARLDRLRAYIRSAWQPLTRTLADLPRAAEDPKVIHAPGTPWPVYLPAGENRDAVAAALARALPAPERARIALRPLPRDPSSVHPPGLLYLPRPYVVPGGRFNEMYGWDSYFILLGLLKDDRPALARDMVDDFLYEVRHYGGVLNANRTYYLTRSQPPLLSEMVLGVAKGADPAWLAAARDAVVASYEHWTTPPHLIESLGLSRYYDHGDGPAPEVVAGERDADGHNHYDRVRAWFRANPDAAAGNYDRDTDQLTPAFFKGDRAMRESGFDPTGRFGPFGADTTRIAPVCLNTLLYRMEMDLAEIEHALGRDAAASHWRVMADLRRRRIELWLWDENTGLYLDYDFERGYRPLYPFATTFWPLWAGVASQEHAQRVHENLGRFERPGGVVTSTKVTGAQWDAPFGWAPLQLFATRGLRRYGYGADADRLARAWLSMLAEDLERRGTLVEKYDVERRTSDVAGKLAFG
ncbi:MAG TPA: trehalase family glycosidase, partial [Polyangia bacterium]|nr:trehalase family glycosidase [Polyangia bacterium]